MIQVLREIKKTPADIERRVISAGGRNRFGNPNFRVVWGWARLDWIGGEWEDRDEHGDLIRKVVQLRQEPKYAPFDRWHLERWLPPEAYGSPRDWYKYTDEKGVPSLGPYPQLGDYEHCLVVQGPNGEYLDLTPGIVDFLISAIERSRAIHSADRFTALKRTAEKKDSDYQGFMDAVLWNEPRFHSQPYVTVA